jgi:hypothetical protein
VYTNISEAIGNGRAQVANLPNALQTVRLAPFKLTLADRFVRITKAEA